MFTENKYTKWYYNIISNARQEADNRKNGYQEKHHIIPKSLGGNNQQDNLVRLTAREHFICHRLLVKMTTGKNKSKMSCALFIFKKRNKYQPQVHITSRTYQEMKIMSGQAMSFFNRGRIVSEETRRKQSESKKITHNTPEYKQKASDRAKNRTMEHKAKIGAKHKGKIISSEMRAKQSLKLSGAKNPRSLSWIISFENGSPDILVKSLKTWCKETQTPYGMIFRTSKLNIFHKGIKATKA